MSATHNAAFVGKSIPRCSALMALLLIALLVGLAYQGSLGIRGQASAKRTTKRVLVVSIDGLDARYLSKRDEFGLKIPTLRKLMGDGITASGVYGVYPTLTYPSHTSIVTGALPIRHGIFGNDAPVPPDENGNIDGLWWAKDIRADTLWDAAHRAGLKVGLVSWPVAGGAGDYNVPEIWKPGGKPAETLTVIAENTRPAGLMSEIEKADPALYNAMTPDDGDDARSRISAYMVEKKQPELMLVHLWDFDHWEHKEGPFTPKAFSVLENVDSYLARILEAYQKAGILEETSVFIVSDHGFLPITQQINPAVLLVRNGLMETAEVKGTDGKSRTVTKSWKAFPYPTAGSCAILLRNPKDIETMNKVRRIFAPLAGNPESGIKKVFNREDLRKLGANADAAVMLEAVNGYAFGRTMTGNLVTASRDKGTHGYLPTSYSASFIAAGPAVKRRGTIGVAQMIDIGPTIATSLGLTLRDASGKSISLR